VQELVFNYRRRLENFSPAKSRRNTGYAGLPGFVIVDEANKWEMNSAAFIGASYFPIAGAKGPELRTIRRPGLALDLAAETDRPEEFPIFTIGGWQPSQVKIGWKMLRSSQRSVCGWAVSVRDHPGRNGPWAEVEADCVFPRGGDKCATVNADPQAAFRRWAHGAR